MTAPASPPAIKRWPLIPTLLVVAVVATMIGLGVWQLRRAAWKEALLTRYTAALHQPAIAFPKVPPTDGSLLFRRAEGFCLIPTSWSARAGRDHFGRAGWRHIVLCRTGVEGPGMAVDMGWSTSADAPKGWRGGPVAGVIDADRDHILLLVSDSAAPGLTPSASPRPTDIPNNHLAYAVQWFLFAVVAVTIYLVALHRRRGEVAAPKSEG